MKTIWIILICVFCLLAFMIVCIEIRTRDLRKKPKKGDRVTFFDGPVRKYGNIVKVFKTTVLVREENGELYPVYIKNLYV